MCCSFLAIQEMYCDQRKILWEFFNGKNVFFSAHTGYGKSLIYQSIPIISDILNDNNVGTSTVLVISPLTSLIQDQVNHINKNFGISAAAIVSGQDEKLLVNIEDGAYSLVYTSPESFLSNKRWRSLATSQTFREDCVAIVIDEAHCLVQWGKSSSHEAAPFRHWYANIVELKSLLLSSTRYAIFTATATTATKHAIFSMLQINANETFCIEKTPLRSNIAYHIIYVNKDMSMESMFQFLIEKLLTEREKTPRCIVFCQTRKQCAVIYRMFTRVLGKWLYASQKEAPTNRLVEMFHAGTPDSVKGHIINEMTKPSSSLRVVICTIAFGMGIDCKNAHRSVHFGPSKNIEMLVQETGRLGRDGQQCYCYVLFNGLLLAHCNDEIKSLVELGSCRRRHVLDIFPKCTTCEIPQGCLCCDICKKTCSSCATHDKLVTFKDHQQPTVPRKIRSVSHAQRTKLECKLMVYRASLLPKTTKEFIPVSSTSILFEFDVYHIKQVLEHCQYLFNITDIMKYIELWRAVHANNVYLALCSVFEDMEESVTPLLITEDAFQDMEYIAEDWEDIMEAESCFEEMEDSDFMSKLDNSIENSQQVSYESFGNQDLSDIVGPMIVNTNMDTE
eukprot:Seg1751.5 transcript_id=Seg1751.5/GoldUCD/mRNA.D3Y31 product="ATP-dependent DNA helicase RecQ" protein_id=Seg1751.5/GoldUCD/D3Y31